MSGHGAPVSGRGEWTPNCADCGIAIALRADLAWYKERYEARAAYAAQKQAEGLRLRVLLADAVAALGEHSSDHDNLRERIRYELRSRTGLW